MSFVFMELIGLENVLICPCWVAEYMWREYTAVKNLINEIRINDIADFDMIEVINIISLRRLIDGGVAMLAAVNINHQRVIIGATAIKPLVKNILRVWVNSYDKLAKINSAEDLNPCAIIIISALDMPHDVLASIPVNINPICPTDEYAINDFRSGWRIQIILVAAAPDNATLINIDDLKGVIL